MTTSATRTEDGTSVKTDFPKPPSPLRTAVVLNSARLLIVGAFLAAWQWLPQIPGIADRVSFLDPFFISSPRAVAQRVWGLTTGSGGTATLWDQFIFTVGSALIGTAIAVVFGTLIGLFLSNSDITERILRPLLVAVNAIPRIAIVPIVVIIVGSSARANIVTAVTVVVFLVFYNALEGGRSVSQEMIDNAGIMGASQREIMFRVRLPIVLGWVAATIPNAIAFGLIGSVTTEIFSGAPGIGQLLKAAVDTADATLTFSVVVVLTVTGVVLVAGTSALQQKLMPWWRERR